MEPNQDEELVRKCKQQLPYDTATFETLLRRYEPIVFRTCLRFLRNEQDAEEACQDAFLRAFHALPAFEQRSTFRTWLFRIVANVCASRYARLKKATARQAEYFAAAEYESHAGDEAEPANLDELDGVIGESLEMLSLDDRQILILRHFSELSLEDLARTLGLGLSAAKMRLYRAEQRLRLAYEESRAKSDD
jgi:RNA polymerase sigma-70 factor (ECF subfamily)